jgi:protein-S-isoprenylcysteine O-methyltransferase Ste14
MVIQLLATLIRAVWVSIEVPYVRRFMVRPRKDWDKHSALLWDIANALEPIGMILGFTNVGRISTGSSLLASLGPSLLVAGIAVRWTAIHTLGKYFTSTVVIKNDHRLIRAGLYKYLRHPAYTGALVAHLDWAYPFQTGLVCS